MIYDIEKIEKAKTILQSIASGNNPINGEIIEEENFINDPRLIRMFYFIAEVLDNVVKGNYSERKISEFILTDEQKNKVVFTEENIGVNEIARCINQQINPLMSKKVTGVVINNGLKRLGVLSEEMDDLGKKRTTTNEKSADYGFQLEKRNYNGVEYYMVVIDEKGKRYILDNIEEIVK